MSKLRVKTKDMLPVNDPRRVLDTKIKAFNLYGENLYDIEYTFEDVLAKFKENPRCHLSGRKIDLDDKYCYSLDHILPKSRGGRNTLENMGLIHPRVNWMKSDSTDAEFIFLCQKVVERRGHEIKGNPFENWKRWLGDGPEPSF